MVTALNASIERKRGKAFNMFIWLGCYIHPNGRKIKKNSSLPKLLQFSAGNNAAIFSGGRLSVGVSR